MSFVLEHGVLWSERTYEFKRRAVREYFHGVKRIQVDGWYEQVLDDLARTDFMSQLLVDEPILRSTHLSDPNGRAELEEMMIDHFESVEYGQGENFYLCRAQGMAGGILLGVWSRFEGLFELLCFVKKEHHFSIINVDKGIYYRFKSEEYFLPCMKSTQYLQV